jgi:hypothetical protein
MIAHDVAARVESRLGLAKPLVEYRCQTCGSSTIAHEGETPRCYHRGGRYRLMTPGLAGSAQVEARKALRGRN